jgi:WD40 repeat protein/serine/threonine protein kinase
MSFEQQLNDLLFHWEELLEQGSPISPEELCSHCPELLGELRRRIMALQKLNPALAATIWPDTDTGAPGCTLSEGKSGPPRTTTVPGYEILSELGRGGMGVVYKARQIGLDRVVALKMILAGAHAGTAQRSRFRTEAEAAAQLHHPNIVGVFEVGEHAGCPWFSLEYVDGRSLHDVLFDGPPPPPQAAALVEQLARAVSYAHSRGIVHRDLKPANVLLAMASGGGEPTGKEPRPGVMVGSGVHPLLAGLVPKITDFGLAKRLDEEQGRTRTGDVVGTPAYMAPEQAAGKNKEIGPATDIYALGAILYELLAGRPPFEGLSAWETVSLVLSADPEPPSRRNPSVPRDVETICLKCLRKEPAKRYGSALELAEDLHRFQAGEPIMARPVSRLERARKWANRHPAVAALLALSSVLLLVLLLGGWVAALRLYRGNKALEAASRENHAALVRLNVTNGTHYLDEDNLFASLVWFARALKLEEEARRGPHRVRIAAVMRQCPWLSQLFFHADSVTDVSFSPDGQWVLTASNDHTANVWNAATGKSRFGAPLRHEDFIVRASFSLDGKRIVTASADRTARVWDAATGRRITTLEGHQEAVRDARFSPDGGRIITAGADGTARVWDAATGAPLGRPLRHGGDVVRASFRPDGNQVLTASKDCSARIWRLESAGAVVVARLRHDGPVTDACFDPAGQQVATASEDGTARLWKASTGSPITAPLRHHGAVTRVVFRPDGRRLATCGADFTARVWDTTTGQLLVPVLRHTSSVSCVTFSPDGTRVLTGSNDNTARAWDAANGRPLTPPLPHNGSLRHADFSPDGRRIVTAAEDTTARIYELVARTPPLKHDGPVWQASFSPAGERVVTASADGSARLWDARTGAALVALRGHKGAVYRASFSRDGGRIVTAGADGTARVWNAVTGQRIVTLEGHKGPVRTAVFSPDGRRVLTAGADKTARVWDATTGAQVLELTGRQGHHREEVLDAVFSPDGHRIATASADHTARLWDARSGQPLGQTMQHQRRVVRVAFSPDGHRLATASFDQTAMLWDAVTGAPLLSAPFRHTGPLRDVSFSPDGQRILTSSDDNTARVWDATTGEPLLPPLRHRGNVETARFSRDGKWVVTASDDNTGRIWDARTGEPLTPALRHSGWGPVTDAAFSPAGDRVVTACADGAAQVWVMGANDWLPEDLEELAELLGGSRIGADGASQVLLEAEALRRHQARLRTRHPHEMEPTR